MDISDELIDPHLNAPKHGQKGSLPHAGGILALGIISIATCFLYGIPGMVCGIIALSLFPKNKKIYESNPSYYEDSFKNAQAGFICAIIGLSLSFVTFVLMIASIATDNFGRGFNI